MSSRPQTEHVGFLSTHIQKHRGKRRQRHMRDKYCFGARRLQMEALESRVVLTNGVVISEFQAANDLTLEDEDGDSSDWIELHNTSLETVNLEGMYLTDNVGNLTKWRFPAVEIGPDEFLVVFASNKDRVDPASELHTDFVLSSNGEFLALVEADGLTIASQYSPEYPPQLPDQSYGLAIGRDTVLLVDDNVPAAVHVPADDSLGTTWTEIGFDDSSWESGTTAIGFEQLAPGFSTRDEFAADLGPEWMVDIPTDGAATFMVDDGKLKVDLPGNQDTDEERGLAPLFLQEAPLLNSDYEIITQVNLTTGNGTAGIVIVDGITGMPGFSLEFNRASSFISQVQSISRADILNTRVQFNTTSVFLRIVRRPFQDTWTTYFKTNGEDEWDELFTATEGLGNVPQISSAKIGLLASTPTGVAVPAEFEFFELIVADEQPVYSPRTGVDVENSMFDKSSSVYVRVPFMVDGDAGRFGEMDLAINYDDGFIAYLNGVEVARRNVPIESAWDSAASGSHGAADGRIPIEVVSLNAHVDLLTAGENVLAFQGMNVAADDGDFFLLPKLTAAEILSTSPQTFLVPTPGTDNSLPAAPQPVFSVAGGTYVGTKIVEITNPQPAPNFQIRYTTDGTVPSETAAIYSGPLTLTNSTWLRATVFDTSFTQAFSPSNTTSAAYIALHSDLASRDSDVPLLVIDTLGQAFPSAGASNLVSGLVSLFDTDPVTDRANLLAGTLEYSGLGGFRRRGSSTGGQAKPSLVFETWGAFEDDFDVSLLGMPAESDWVLYAPFNWDRTLIHEQFVYELSRDIGRYASRTKVIEVYANTNGGVLDQSDYIGVYMLEEKIKQDPDRVDIAAADPNATYTDLASTAIDDPITGGYIWKIDRADPGEPPFTAGGRGLNWVYPKHPNNTGRAQRVTPAQQAYVNDYFNEFRAVLDGPNYADPIDGYAKYIDVDAWIDHHLINNLTENVDALELSTYLHKDAGKKIAFGPAWDFDRSLESLDDRDNNPADWAVGGRNLFQSTWWSRLFQDPNFFQKYIDRYHELRQAEFSNDSIDARIDKWAAVVEESRVRDLARWNQTPRTNCPAPADFCDGTWEGEVEHMRDWLHRHLQFMDETFPIVPTLSLDGDALPVQPEGVAVTPGAEVTGLVPDKPGVGTIVDGTVLVSGDPGTVPITYFVPGDNGLGDTWTAVDFDDSAWNAGTNGIGYQNVTIVDYTDLITTTVKPRDVVDDAATIMTRTEFDIADPAAIEDLVLQVKYDDAYVAYLNGTEVARQNVTGVPSWNQGAGNHSNSLAVKYENADLTLFKHLIVPGKNVLAIQVINSAVDVLFDLGIADMLLLPQLVSGELTGEPGGTLYYTTDGSDPRGLDGLPSATAAELGRDDSIVISENTRVIIRNLDETDHGSESNIITTDWSAPITHNFIVATGELTITELNYNPADPTADELAALPGLDNDDFEFLEILNTGAQPLDLTGIELTDGVTFDFTTGAISSLAPGEYLLVVRNQAAFELRYGTDLPVAGVYEGSLNNGGERVTLVDGRNETLFSIEYNDGRIWPQTADGIGATLELIDPAGTPMELADKHYVWRGSTAFGGSPAFAGAAPLGVVINEILAHTDPPVQVSDSIELRNTTNDAIDIGGWYLSDATGNLQKFQIPLNTVLGAGEYIVFDESNFNPGGGANETDFALSGTSGDDVWLTVPAGNGGIGAFVDDAHFIASLNGESFGRVTGAADTFAPMLANTLGGPNSLPRVGPLIISEINYSPGMPSAAALAIDAELTADDLEFVEIYNPTVANVELTDWRLRGAVDATFVAGTTIGAGETLVLISFNPDNPDNVLRLDAFRTHYGIDADVRLSGGYGGELSDNGELVELQRADHPEPAQPLIVSHVSEDAALYDNVAPWPTSAHGTGNSLQRSAPSLYGSFASSWLAGIPSPGSAEFGDLAGDFTGDGVVNAADINVLFGAISSGNMAPEFDLDNNETVDHDDVRFLVENIIGTFAGDANLDGKVDAVDLNQIGINWRRMDGVGWANGDFNGDGAVDARDLNLVGINWQRGIVAAAPVRQRVPRAPLAAIHVVTTAIVDEAIERVSRNLSSIPDQTASAPVKDAPLQNTRALGRLRFDAAKSRRDVLVGHDERADHDEFVELRLIDELFGSWTV